MTAYVTLALIATLVLLTIAIVSLGACALCPAGHTRWARAKARREALLAMGVAIMAIPMAMTFATIFGHMLAA
jgi:hypothetical protein